MDDLAERLKQYLPSVVLDSLEHLPVSKRKTPSEIRLRLGRACSISIDGKNEMLLDYKSAKALCLNSHDINACFRKICENSVYKYENEIKNGYITLSNGCRAGFCGTRVSGGFIKDISSINFRVARRVSGVSSSIMRSIMDENKIFSSLIVGAPCAGKTTILSDIADKLGKKYRVSIVDERGELAAVHQGMPQKIFSPLCDVLDNYPKGEGMMIALRTLSPQVLICDEIGTDEDVKAMMQAFNGGVPVIASAHAEDELQLLSRPQLKLLLDNGAIEKVFFLEGPSNPGKLKKVASAKEIYETIGSSSDFYRCCLGS